MEKERERSVYAYANPRRTSARLNEPNGATTSTRTQPRRATTAANVEGGDRARTTANAGLRSQTQEPDKGKRRDDLRSPTPSSTTHKNGIVAMYPPPYDKFQESHRGRPPRQRASPQSEGGDGNARSKAMAEEATREEEDFLAPPHPTPKQHHLNQPRPQPAPPRRAHRSIQRPSLSVGKTTPSPKRDKERGQSSPTRRKMESSASRGQVAEDGEQLKLVPMLDL